MKYCPITYDSIAESESYSSRGLKRLSPQLRSLKSLALSADEQRQEAVARVGKMSIQGVQTKLSAQLNVKEGCFELVDQKGHYILKPQSEYYPELPENEALTMSLAAMIGMDVPVHGLVYGKDNSMTYFVKRFDRYSHNKKRALEDFAQLSYSGRDTKYRSSMEKVADIILHSGFCSFPKIDAVKLFKLTLFNFLIGNEDMHLKNFSLITQDQKVTLSPAYDLLNSTIAQMNAQEEMALPLNGKKNNLTKRDFIDYFAIKKLQINPAVVADIMDEFTQMIPAWTLLIGKSFLSVPMQKQYLSLLNDRAHRMDLL